MCMCICYLSHICQIFLIESIVSKDTIAKPQQDACLHLFIIIYYGSNNFSCSRRASMIGGSTVALFQFV